MATKNLGAVLGAAMTAMVSVASGQENIDDVSSEDTPGMQITLNCADGPSQEQVCLIDNGVLLINPRNGVSLLCDNVDSDAVLSNLNKNKADFLAEICKERFDPCNPSQVQRLVPDVDPDVITRIVKNSASCRPAGEGYLRPVPPPSPDVSI